MKNSRFSFIVFILLSCALLSACQEKNKDAKQEVLQYVKRIEDASKKSEINKLQEPVQITHVEYDGSNSRDPFESPANAMVKNAKQYPDTILRDMSIDSLKLTGIVLHKDGDWAIFRANNGKIYKVAVGMRVGMQQALLTQISQNEVKFTIDKISADEGKREVVMTIQGSGQ